MMHLKQLTLELARDHGSIILVVIYIMIIGGSGLRAGHSLWGTALFVKGLEKG